MVALGHKRGVVMLEKLTILETNFICFWNLHKWIGMVCIFLSALFHLTLYLYDLFILLQLLILIAMYYFIVGFIYLFFYFILYLIDTEFFQLVTIEKKSKIKMWIIMHVFLPLCVYFCCVYA